MVFRWRLKVKSPTAGAKPNRGVMNITEITIEVDGADDIRIKRAGPYWPKLYTLINDVMEEPLYINEETLQDITDAIALIKGAKRSG